MSLLRWRSLAFVAFVAAMLVAVARAYAPADDATFVWDDHVLVERDAPFRHAPIAAVMTGTFWPDSPLSDARAPYYRPLVLLSFRVDAALGTTAQTFHRTNVLLHLAGCILVVVVAVRLGARPGGALLAGLLWGLAPRLSESVMWISGRTDLLAGVLGLLALALAPDVTVTRRDEPWWATQARAMASGLFLFGALASKEVAVAFAVAIAAAIYRSRRGKSAPRWLLRLAINVVAPVALWALLRTLALQGKSVSPRDLGIGRRLATALEALARYAEMLVDALRPQTVIGMLGEVDAVRAIVGGALLAALIVALGVLWRRTSFGVRVATIVGGVGLGLVLHLLPFTLAGGVTADRLLYVPGAALAIGVAVALAGVRPRIQLAAGGLAALLACAFFVATRARARDYGDEALFWVVAAERAHPHNTMPWSALAGVVRDADELELACRLYERAESVLAQSERVGLTAHRRARENLVTCWANIGRFADARRLAEELAEAYPESGRIRMELGFARLHELDFDGALEAFATATRLEPALASVVRPAVEDAMSARREATTFAPQNAADRPRFARHLTRIGHRAKAEELYLAIVEEPSSSLVDRSVALQFLVTYGRLPTAQRAVSACRLLPGVDVSEANRRLAVREQQRAPVVALTSRIEALARR